MLREQGCPAIHCGVAWLELNASPINFFHFEVLPWEYHRDNFESGNSHSIVLVSIIPLVKDDCIAISGYSSPF